MDPLSIISKSLPLAPRGQAYSVQLQAIGGTPVYSWSVVSGALPAGIVLSSSGLLSAALAAIPESAIGVHSFDIQVEDTIPDTDVISVTIEVVPYGFDRVVEFLLDSRLRGLIDNLQLNDITREKMEKHFFRGALGDPEQTIVHLDHDILSEDWPSGGTDSTLREVIDALALAASEAIKTINDIPPNLGNQDFDVLAGPGVTVTPITDGIQIDVDDLQALEKVEISGPLSPGVTLNLDVSTHPDLFMAQVETEASIWYSVSDIPEFAGKSLENSIVVNSAGVLGFALGDRAGTPVVHVLWDDDVSGKITLSRFHGETLALEETFLITPAAPIVGDPLVMVGSTGQVIVAWCDTATDIYFGVFNPADYTDTTSPTYLNPPIATAALNPAAPNLSTSRLVGAVAPTGPAAALCYIGFDNSGTPTIAEFDIVTPGSSLGYTGKTSTGSAGGSWLDMIVDSTVPSLLVVGVDGFGGPTDNFSMWSVALNPFVIGPMTAVVLHGPVADGAYFENAMILVDDSPSGGPARAVTVPYVFNDGSYPPSFSLREVYLDQTHAWPTASPPVLNTVGRTLAPAGRYAFIREWDSGGGDRCEGYFIDSELAGTNDHIMRRTQFVPNVGVLEASTIVAVHPTVPIWIIPGFTSELTTNAWQTRILTSDDLFASIAPTFGEKNINVKYDDIQKKIIVENNSPFEWTTKIQAAILTGGFDLPPNLMIPCYQLAQALKDFVDDATFYPSPSTSAGVTWSETQLASANTSGYTFSTYYSVVPGSYDMHGGSVAQAFYYADEVAGLASDQTLVFRYNYMPTEILAAETVIAADITANLPLTHPSAGGAANPNFYTLAELDVKLGSSYAATYTGPPFDYYRYFCFLDNAGAVYHQGWFSQNYVDTHLAYGPHATTTPTIPVTEHFILAADETQDVPTVFNLAHAVASAHLYINGTRYWKDIDWEFGTSMSQISYLNRAGTGSDPGYTLQQYDRVSIDKYLL